MTAASLRLGAIALGALLAACPTSSTPTTTPAPTPGSDDVKPNGSAQTTPPPQEPTPAEPTPTGPGIGEKCGANDACAAPATCVTYYGIAGPRGPAFKSCEIKCTPKSTDCPTGRTCTTIADGPGSVCR